MNRPPPKISLPSGPLDVPAESQKTRNSWTKKPLVPIGKLGLPRPKKRLKKPTPVPTFEIQIPSLERDLLIEFGKRSERNAVIRTGVSNCVFLSDRNRSFTAREIWDNLGRWTSTLRGMPQIEGITEKHQAWQHIQRLRYAIDRASSNPLLHNIIRQSINQFVIKALDAWDTEMHKYFAKHPEALMTPDEYLGMTKAPRAEVVIGIGIFTKPDDSPKISRELDKNPPSNSITASPTSGD